MAVRVESPGVGAPIMATDVWDHYEREAARLLRLAEAASDAAKKRRLTREAAGYIEKLSQMLAELQAGANPLRPILH